MIVAVLAGGRGRRMGASKAAVPLAGEPLIARPLAAARAAGLDAVVVAKPDTELPPLAEPAQLPVLRDALAQEASLRATLARLRPAALGADPAQVASVNTREDLAAAERALA